MDLMVSIDGGEPVMALSVAYVLAMALARRGAACLVFPGVTRRGYLSVRGERGEAEVFFFHDLADLPEFWRRLFSFENVSEHGFFDLAQLAFPSLVFHPSLSFGRFEGAYSDVRDRLVMILSALNDHFVDERHRCKGLPNEIQAAMGRYHVELSPESPNTRSSQKLMRQRDVTYDGRTIRCEWHAKLESHRNRIHFSEPSEHLGERILIGIFVAHLDT